jgi:hypothetical protein
MAGHKLGSLTKETTMAASSHPQLRFLIRMPHLAMTNRPAVKIMTSEVIYSLHPWSSAPLLGKPIPRSRISVEWAVVEEKER